MLTVNCLRCWSMPTYNITWSSYSMKWSHFGDPHAGYAVHGHYPRRTTLFHGIIPILATSRCGRSGEGTGAGRPISLSLFRLWVVYNACMENTVTLTEADILSEVVAPEDPTLNEEFARAVLAVRFTDAATGRIRDLLQRNNAGTLTPAEKSNLEKYMRVGQFIDLMQAKARLSLKPSGSTS
jgi:hypothetical protein